MLFFVKTTETKIIGMKKLILTPLIKKFVMAVTGFALASFLLIHMLGNLQVLEGPKAINVYANFLQTLPWEILWGFRIGLAACFVIHFCLAYLLVVENAKARPQSYSVKKSQACTLAARTMIYTGTLVLLFAVIHILHYTVLCLNPEFSQLEWKYEGKAIHDVYAMLILGFSNEWVSLGYIVAMIAISFHLSHGVTSMFQSIGFRNETWRYFLNKVAVAYCIIIGIGFCVNPAVVLISSYTDCQIVPAKCVIKQYEAQKDKKGPIFIKYACPKTAATCTISVAPATKTNTAK